MLFQVYKKNELWGGESNHSILVPGLHPTSFTTILSRSFPCLCTTRLISTSLSRNEGPRDQREAGHLWNKFQNDGKEPDHDELTEGLESRYLGWPQALQP